MTTEDDAHMTLQLDDRYIICPALSWWSDDAYTVSGATSVPEGFRYASNTNDRWLDADTLLKLLAE